jgi:hypothetical protein
VLAELGGWTGDRRRRAERGGLADRTTGGPADLARPVHAGDVGGDPRHRDVEHPAAPALDGGDRLGGGGHARQRIGDGVGHEAGALLVPRHQSPGHRRVVAEPGALASGAPAAVGGDRHPDDRAVGGEGVGVDPELLERSRARALDHDVSGGDELVQHAEVAAVGEVEGDGLVPLVHPVVEAVRTQAGAVGT